MSQNNSMLLSLLLLLSAAAPPSLGCPDAWVRVGKSCYHVSEERANWEVARQVSWLLVSSYNRLIYTYDHVKQSKKYKYTFI